MKKPFMVPVLTLIKRPLEWWAEYKAEKDTETYLRLNREYDPIQAKRIWVELKRRRKAKWWKL